MVSQEEKEKISKKRWIVTYTKHMKQKRKVYQDGVLELCSSSGKPQVMLYDDCEKLIDRRFLKKDEIVKSGGNLSFETHIVDIGDPDGNKSSAESNVKSVIRPESQKEKLCVEWNVLYTTHMTQKAKRYHDGILRVLVCSSHLNLITLLNEDGAILSSKYLKSVACVEKGKNCEFPNYLVEICGRRASAAGQEGSSNVRPSCKDLHMKDSMNQVSPSKPEKFVKLVTSRKGCEVPLYNVPKMEVSGCRTLNARASAAPSNLPKDHSEKVTNNCNSKIGSFINSSTATLRDAWQILSVLKQPSPEGSLVLGDPFVEQDFSSQSSDRCQLDLKVSSEKTGTLACHGLKSVNSQKASISAAGLVLDADCEGSSSENDRASSIWSSGEMIHVMNPIVPLNGKQHLSASTSNLLKDNLDADERSSLHGMDTGISSDSTLDQLCAKTSQTVERYESVSFDITASTVHATSDDTKDPVIPSSAELANVEDLPTFDLGF